MNPILLLDSNNQEIAAVCRRYGVERLRLFGSACRQGWNEETSDFDFLAEFGPAPPGVNRFDQQFGLQADLERLLGRSVDVVDWNAARRPLFRQIADAEAVVVYAA